MDINYYSLSQHAFVEEIFKKGLKISNEITLPNGLKVGVKYKRDPLEHEFYCLQLSSCLSHLLTVVQQMEHTILYMSNFSPSETMKKSGVNRATHLLWSVENYIVRTQTVYDRLLVLVDRLFHIQNQTNRISHESIVTNTHISRTSIPKAMRPVKSAVKKYYPDRNKIIHESSFMDDDLRRIEGISILVSNPDYDEYNDENLKDDLKYFIRKFIKNRKREYARINKSVCSSLVNLFDEMQPVYTKKYAELCAKK